MVKRIYWSRWTFCCDSWVSKNTNRLACNFELVQKQVDLSGEDYSQILSKISSYLLSNLKETKINTKNPQYRIRTTSLNGNLVLKDVFN